MDSVYIRAYKLHKKLQGKLSIKTKVKPDKKNLSLLYTPGVGGVAKEIAKNSRLIFDTRNFFKDIQAKHIVRL